MLRSTTQDVTEPKNGAVLETAPPSPVQEYSLDLAEQHSAASNLGRGIR